MPSKKTISKPSQSIIKKKRAERLLKRQLLEQEDFSNYYKNLLKENVKRDKLSIKPKVKQNISKIDFTNALPNLFNESPVVEHNISFQNVTSDFIIKNIQENDISKYFKTIKESVHETISNFKGRDNIKFKLIITSQFTTPLAFDRIEAHFDPEFEILLTMNNFDDIYQNLEEEFLAWVDKFQDNGSGFVFEEII